MPDIPLNQKTPTNFHGTKSDEIRLQKLSMFPKDTFN